MCVRAYIYTLTTWKMIGRIEGNKSEEEKEGIKMYPERKSVIMQSEEKTEGRKLDFQFSAESFYFPKAFNVLTPTCPDQEMKYSERLCSSCVCF